ncbi:MAG TPA: DsbC family protein [Syntrophorhabdaceae bacterium]|nr:DsbC family protein [Syntrophorhabdaceae bacterium]
MNRQAVFFIFTVFLLLGLMLSSLVSAETVEDGFKKMFPRHRFDLIRKSEIKGAYEVIKGTDIGLFFPEPGYLIIGDFAMIDRDGKNVAEKKRNEFFLAKTRTLPLDKALKIGSGKNTVIEITDPDCPYCRRAAAFFEKRSDVTKYVFFLPLPYNKDAENKIKYIFCAGDKAKAYYEAMQGKLDNRKYEACSRQDAVDLLQTHKDITTKLGISGTPSFIINNSTVVVGADLQKIEGALKEK